MNAYLKTIIQPNGKIKFTIVTPDGTHDLPVEVRATIDSYNKDIFWKPGTTQRPLYDGKNIYQLTHKRYVFYLKIGKIHYIPECEHFSHVRIIWNEPYCR